MKIRELEEEKIDCNKTNRRSKISDDRYGDLICLQGSASPPPPIRPVEEVEEIADLLGCFAGR